VNALVPCGVAHLQLAFRPLRDAELELQQAFARAKGERRTLEKGM